MLTHRRQYVAVSHVKGCANMRERMNPAVRQNRLTNQRGVVEDCGGEALPKKRKQLHGTVEKVIKSDHSSEKAQIAIHEAEHLYREIRVENELTNGDGEKPA